MKEIFFLRTSSSNSASKYFSKIPMIFFSDTSNKNRGNKSRKKSLVISTNITLLSTIIITALTLAIIGPKEWLTKDPNRHQNQFLDKIKLDYEKKQLKKQQKIMRNLESPISSPPPSPSSPPSI